MCNHLRVSSYLSFVKEILIGRQTLLKKGKFDKDGMQTSSCGGVVLCLMLALCVITQLVYRRA
jgi:hypothetical protein